MKAIEIYAGSDGDATLLYYRELCQRGAIGEIAMNLFRAQKCSGRAKVYRGGIRGRGSYKSLAYGRKQWSMELLANRLNRYAGELGIGWGWKPDSSTVFGERASWVLYVDLPEHGQVSFHSPVRGEGPDYDGEFDGQQRSAERIIAFCDQVYSVEVAA